MIKKLAVRSRNIRCGVSVIIAALFIVALSLNALPYSSFTDRFVVNTTASMPVGIYKIIDEPITRGVIVGACVPESYATLAKDRDYVGHGKCPNGLRPVMKHVVAVEGDEISITPRGVSVNGESLANTRVLRLDANGNALPNQFGRHLVAKGQYWLVSNSHPGCFDSRYFGSVTKTLGVVQPLITRNTLCNLNLFSHFIRCSGDSQ
jgi:conjugative transfer signal peptidase TraF